MNSTLRAMVEADLPTVRAWRNAEHVRMNMFTSHVISEAEHRAWWEAQRENPKTRLLVFELDGTPVGVVTFTAYTGPKGVASWGFYVGDPNRRGVGASMGKAALDYAFEVLKLRRLEGEVLAFNERGLRYHERLGFRVEGIRRDAYTRDGRAHDVYSVALLARSRPLGATVSTKRTTMKIAGREIGRGAAPFVIAEMSGNHNQSLERALEIVDAAAATAAHALKIQTYTPDTMTLDLDEREFHIDDPKSLWAGTSLYKLYGEAQTPWEWHAPIFERARERGIIAFSTPFDDTAVDLLESLDAPCYKIASFENTDLPLIRRVAATGKPLIISTGMASLEELDETVQAARDAGCRHLVLLKCTSSYPASPTDTNLMTIPALRERYGCEVGLSDHTMGVGAAVASVALGASVIEKHFTLARADGGVDSAFSLEPAELAQLVVEAERAWQALGEVRFGPTDAEKRSLVYRRSLYIVTDAPAGTVLTAQHVRAIRPGLGLPPKHLEQVLGRRVKADVKRGTPVSWALFD